MVNYSNEIIVSFFRTGENSKTTVGKGRALEDLICYLFENLPGISITRRNQMNQFLTEEIDVAFFNDQHPDGIYFFPHIFIVECKNWSKAVGTEEVSYFIKKVENRGLTYGIFIATNDITGADYNRAHFEVALALSKGIRIIVINKQEILGLKSTDNLVQLLKIKLCDLAVSGKLLS